MNFRSGRSIRRGAVLAAACAAWILAGALQAKEPKPGSDWQMRVEADRPDATYRCGETVTFTLTLLYKDQKAGENGSQVRAKWILSKDGVEPRREGAVEWKDGQAVVTGKLDEPGFLQCRVDFVPPGEKTRTLRGGAAVSPLEIKPSLPAPDDFDAFWAEQKKLLAAVPMNVRMTPVKSPVEGVECFDVQADCPLAPMSAYLARPIGAKAKTLPAMVLTHGAGVASSRLSVAAAWAKDGFLTLDFNAHGLPNGQPREFYTDLYAGKLKQYYLQSPESREGIFFRGLFVRLMRAMDVLTSQPEWDGRILVANGRSQGGGQSIAAAGLDPRVTFVVAQIPAMCDPTGVAVGRINGWPKLVPLDKSGKPDEKAMAEVRYFDGVNFAARTKAGAFFTVGFIDVSCPPTTVYAAYNQFTGPKTILNQLHLGHAATPEADAAARQAVLDYLRSARNTPASAPAN